MKRFYRYRGRCRDLEAVASGDRTRQSGEGPTGFQIEIRWSRSRLVAALEEAGGRATDLLQLRIFVTDLAAYLDARSSMAKSYRELLGSHYPASTLVEVGALLEGAAVEIEGLAAAPRGESTATVSDGSEDAVIRLRLGPGDVRYAGGIAAGSKAMEIFADLETELALREGGDEGLCVAYDMVEFLTPLRAGDFVEGRARVVSRGRTSRRIAAEIHKILAVDEHGVLEPSAEPVLAARASATIVVGTSEREGRG